MIRSPHWDCRQRPGCQFQIEYLRLRDTVRAGTVPFAYIGMS
jgi:hypothetical protein